METTVVLNTIFAGFVGQQAIEIVIEMLKFHILINCCLQVVVQRTLHVTMGHPITPNSIVTRQYFWYLRESLSKKCLQSWEFT